MGSDPPAPGHASDTLGGLLKNRTFDFYMGSRAAAAVGMSVQTAAIAWQVYDLTGAALPLAFIGLARFIPAMLISFLAGAVADTRDRRVIIGIAQLAPLTTSAVLGVMTATGTIRLPLIYVFVALLGMAQAFEGPARASLLPQVVPRASFQRAISMATTLQQFSAIVGPATGGLIIARYGVAPAYLFHIAIVLVGLACLAGMRIPPRTGPRGALSLALVKEGLTYIRAHPAVLGAMVLDMFAVIFAGAEALLPIYARDILNVGAFGYGLLTASKGVGAFMMAVALALLPPRVSTGRIMVVTVTLYGLATILFGLSTWFPLSLVAYGLIAMSDQLSVVIRQTIIQLETPDALRGRVSSVNSLFVGASNQLGAVESGLVATWTGSAVVAVVSGGIGCLASVGIITALIPSLWRHRVQLETPAVEQPVRSG